ncbi:unnamed protein product [Rotaria socialis]|uniref:Uncharacterized protein n=2 Tax=Rotaria socialis TaxID=392032 RepID=A0A820JC64_9BILA|nr:unnamed protein product [Rotaria socialis]CAF3432836.1 unnamed protein product [Rotaria socialis]CAF3438386.1 unnamed protein product [Rotaria socialis]CAF3454212.1 unnamed protein product [Rotaria socialis]CAF4322557.1 unnamed protein product [Rotaria socialis]
MILAAAACAVAGAAGLSYVFDDDEQSLHRKYETVTVSSTIADKQGVVKCVIHPYSYMYPPFLRPEQNKTSIRFINQNQLKLPIEINKLKANDSIFKRNFSIVFFWSMPLKARLLQTSTKPCFSIENSNIYEHKSIKFSVGIQNEINGISNVSSEIVLSNLNDEYDNTFDSLTLYNPIRNDDTIPIGVLNKKKSSITENNNNNQKRFCCDKILDSNQNNLMRNIILKNVNLCVDNLSKVLSESCSNNEKQSATLQDSISFDNSKSKTLIQQDIYQNIHSQSFKKHDESFNSNQIALLKGNNITNSNERVSDGVILHRGKQFGKTLGEPIARKYYENEECSTRSSHLINVLNRLLSKTSCLLMRQYNIQSIEDLIRLFLEHGQQNFTEIMINDFKVNSCVVEQINMLLIEWTRKLT